MKAAVYYGPGDVRIENAPEPGHPGPGEVVLRVLLGSLCGTDASQFKDATMIPLHARHSVTNHLGPVILGHEVVGMVTEVGAEVDRLVPGQVVVPGSGWWCGVCPQCLAGRMNICERYFLYGIHAHGGLAEFARYPAQMCMPVPYTCKLEAAVMGQPCAVALHALQRSGIRDGDTVAIFGIGGIGSLLLAVLRAQKAAVTVLAVDLDAQRLSTAQALGANCVIDAGTGDPLEMIRDLTRGRGVSVTIEATGVPEMIGPAVESVCRGGTLLQVGIPQRAAPLPIDLAVLHEKTLVTTNGQVTPLDLPQALALLAETDLASLVGYRVIPLDALVEEGLCPLAEHRAAAKVVVEVANVLAYPA